MKRAFLATVVGILVSLANAPSARADAVYAFVFGTPTPLTIGADTFLDVPLYLQETVTGGTSPLLVDEELSTAALIIYRDPIVPATPVSIDNILNAVDPTAFINVAPDSADAVLWPVPNVPGALVSSGVYQVELFTLRLKTTGATGTTTFHTADYDTNLDDTTTGLGTVLDGLITQATLDITINAVPLPSSASMMAVGLLLIIIGSRFRRTA